MAKSVGGTPPKIKEGPPTLITLRPNTTTTPDNKDDQEGDAVPLKAYTDAQTRAVFYRALFDITKHGKPNPQLVVLYNTATIFLNPNYKPQLLSAEAGKMGGTQTALNINLKAYRAQLVQMIEDYKKKGMKDHQNCVDTLLTAFDKQQLLTLAQLQGVYDVLGDEVTVPKGQMRQMLDQVVKQGVITPAEAAEMENKLMKVDNAAKQAPEMIVGPDGNVISKKKSEGGGTLENDQPGDPRGYVAMYRRN